MLNYAGEYCVSTMSTVTPALHDASAVPKYSLLSHHAALLGSTFAGLSMSGLFAQNCSLKIN